MKRPISPASISHSSISHLQKARSTIQLHTTIRGSFPSGKSIPRQLQADTKGGNQQQIDRNQVYNHLLQQPATKTLILSHCKLFFPPKCRFFSLTDVQGEKKKKTPKDTHFRSLTNTGSHEELLDWLPNQGWMLFADLLSDLSLERHMTHQHRMLQSVNHWHRFFK